MGCWRNASPAFGSEAAFGPMTQFTGHVDDLQTTEVAWQLGIEWLDPMKHIWQNVI